MVGRWIGGALGFFLWVFFPPSARDRSIRLTIFMLLLIGIAVASLGFKNIDINVPGGADLKRGGTGPLGLKLGLDLRGGGHLVYQADTGTRFNLEFEEPSTPADVEEALRELRFGEEELAFESFTVQARSLVGLQVKTPLLGQDDPRRTEFQETLEAESGLSAIASLDIEDVEAPSPDQMQGVLEVISGRVNLFGTEEPIIQQFGDDRLIVQLPGASGSVTEVGFVDPVPEPADEETLRSALSEAGYEDLEVQRQDDRSFRIGSATVSTSKREAAAAVLGERLGIIERFRVTSAIDDAKSLIGRTAQLVFRERTCTSPQCIQFTDADIGLTGEDLSQAYAQADNVGIGWVVIIHFNGRGSDIFADLTCRIVGQPDKRIAFFLDREELLAPVAQACIRDGVTRITGNFTREEAKFLAIQLEAGSLPVPLRVIQEADVDALLGAESLRNSLIAGLVGLGLVMAFMVAYYRMAGVVAAVALVFYAVVVLAVFKLIPITLTLSHIGGFILSIGMAVDANVLIFERMKEEVRIGRTLASSMEVGFSRAWPAIRDGNISTLITCGVLLWFGDRLGGALVTGFAISLGIGVLISMFTAVVVSRNLLQLLAWVGLGGRISLFTPEGAARTTRTAGGGG